MRPGWTIHETVAPIMVNRRGLGWRWKLWCLWRWLLQLGPK